MTFCLGMNLEEGLVGIADTRVLSGHESLMAKKVATYQGPGFSFFVMTSGLRSLREKVLLWFEDVFARQTDVRTRLFKVVNLYAAQVRRVADEDGPSLRAADFRFNVHTLHRRPDVRRFDPSLVSRVPGRKLGGGGTGHALIRSSAIPDLASRLSNGLWRIPIRLSTRSSSACSRSTPAGSARRTSIFPSICCYTGAAPTNWWNTAMNARI